MAVITVNFVKSFIQDEAKHLRMISRLATLLELKNSARNGDGPKTYEYLQKAGKWALDIACKISVPVDTEGAHPITQDYVSLF